MTILRPADRPLTRCAHPDIRVNALRLDVGRTVVIVLAGKRYVVSRRSCHHWTAAFDALSLSRSPDDDTLCWRHPGRDHVRGKAIHRLTTILPPVDRRDDVLIMDICTTGRAVVIVLAGREYVVSAPS